MKILGPIPDNILRRMSPQDRPPGNAGRTFEEAEARRTDRLESDIQDNIARLLEHRGIPYNRSRMDKATTGTVGWPDFTFAVKRPSHPGQYSVPCGIEVKRPGTKPTADQERVLADLERGGWFVRVVRSETEFLDALKAIQT